jgi:hypothetical protein
VCLIKIFSGNILFTEMCKMKAGVFLLVLWRAKLSVLMFSVKFRRFYGEITRHNLSVNLTYLIILVTKTLLSVDLILIMLF